MISPPLDEQFFTVMAVRVISLINRDIPGIYVPDSLPHGQFSESDQGRDGRGRQPVQLVLSEKSQEMEGMVRTKILEYPGAHFLYKIRIINISRHNQVCHFKMYSLFVQGSEGV